MGNCNHLPACIRARLTAKIHTSYNQRFHVYRMETGRRSIQAIYFGIDCPSVSDSAELLLTGKWQHSSEYGPQFLIISYEPAGPGIRRVRAHLREIYDAIGH